MNNQTAEILRALAEAELRVAETLFVQNNTDLSLRSAALIKYEALRDIANRINDEQDQGMQQLLVSDSLPSPVKFELQKIALADDEMVSKPGAAVKYRGMIRNILEVYGGNISVIGIMLNFISNSFHHTGYDEKARYQYEQRNDHLKYFVSMSSFSAYRVSS